MSGLTDFSIRYKIKDTHFTAIGATSSAMLAWLDLSKKAYRRIPVTEQAEVLSMIGDIATFDGKPVVHTHVEVGRSDGSTVARHVFELNVTLPRSLCHCGCHASKKKAGRCLRHEDD